MVTQETLVNFRLSPTIANPVSLRTERQLDGLIAIKNRLLKCVAPPILASIIIVIIYLLLIFKGCHNNNYEQSCLSH